MICSITQPGISYVYDYAGNTDNIVKETRTSGSYAGETTYAYDTLGQLTRVNDPVENATWVYTYDRGGNILNKKKYAYTTGTVGAVQQTINYTYNSAWKDKLATYNGTTLSYDAIGNLTGDGTWTYTWAGGRQLSGMSKSGTAITYAYNNSGLRVRKTVAGVVTNYTLNGNLITHLTKGSDWMHFFYDGQGKPSIVNYKGATYRYLYNLQGDVIGLVDTSGNVVVEYKYDAWGKIIARTGSLASTLGYLNPFRYRGYVYDEETGLYYLRSRYYNPEWGRFINADVVMGEIGGTLSHNLFAYCLNSPIDHLDLDGMLAYQGEIHYAVCKHICNNGTFVKTGTAVIGIDYPGLIDIIDTTNMEIYEVKRFTTSAPAALRQLRRYLKGVLDKWEKASPRRGSKTIMGTFTHTGGDGKQYHVFYASIGYGIILYDYTGQEDEKSHQTVEENVRVRGTRKYNNAVENDETLVQTIAVSALMAMAVTGCGALVKQKSFDSCPAY